MSNMSSVENIIYGSFVKMNRLQDITIETFSNTSIASATELNVFIDIYSVLKTIFSESYRTNIDDYTAITSCLINMCGHYRTFFRTLSVKTKFFLVFSFNTCDINEKFVAGYNNSFKKKSEIPLFNKLANDNFELLETICPYLPDIFFIRSLRNYESAVIMANLIEKVNANHPAPNLIISKDLYPIQLCYLYPYTSYLYPIKRIGSDESIMIPISEKASAFRYQFWNLISRIRKISLDSIGNISPVNFPLFSAMNRFPERGINGLINISETRNTIMKIVGSEDIKILPKQLYDDVEISSKLPVAIIESRLKALDVEFMLPYYRNDPESISIKLENRNDSSTLNMINSKYFSKNPMELGRL